MKTLAETLGETCHLSPLLRKCRRLGLTLPEHLRQLAVQRGCHHYANDEAPVKDPGTDCLGNAELLVALLVGEHPHELLNLRLAAQLLGGEEDFPRLFHLARMERVLPRLAYLLDQATRVEPDRPHWKNWRSRLPDHPYPDGLLPHATRFAVPAPPENRRIPRGPQRFHWLRPHPARGTLNVERAAGASSVTSPSPNSQLPSSTPPACPSPNSLP